MGEFAVRVKDSAEIKIGTCENMYYLRFEDRYKVRQLDGNVDAISDADKLRFRIPFPDEDGMQPGEYGSGCHSRGLRLCRQNASGYWQDFELPQDDCGLIQLRHDSGLLINVTCYHGTRLPKDVQDEIHFFWNGKSWFAEVTALRPVIDPDDSKILHVDPIISCRWCRSSWRCDWADIWDYISPDMQERFAAYKAGPVPRWL